MLVAIEELERLPHLRPKHGQFDNRNRGASARPGPIPFVRTFTVSRLAPSSTTRSRRCPRTRLASNRSPSSCSFSSRGRLGAAILSAPQRSVTASAANGRYRHPRWHLSSPSPRDHFRSAAEGSRGSFRCPSRRGARRGAAMAQSLKDLAGRLPAGPRGVGTALKLLLGAGALAYGVRESVFIGEFSPGPRPILLSRHPPPPRTDRAVSPLSGRRAAGHLLQPHWRRAAGHYPCWGAALQVRPTPLSLSPGARAASLMQASRSFAGFPGSSTPSSMTSAPGRGRFPPPRAPKVRADPGGACGAGGRAGARPRSRLSPQTCRWWTSPCASSPAPMLQSCPACISAWAWTTRSESCPPSSTRCSRAWWPNSTPRSSSHREPRWPFLRELLLRLQRTFKLSTWGTLKGVEDAYLLAERVWTVFCLWFDSDTDAEAVPPAFEDNIGCVECKTAPQHNNGGGRANVNHREHVALELP